MWPRRAQVSAQACSRSPCDDGRTTKGARTGGTTGRQDTLLAPNGRIGTSNAARGARHGNDDARVELPSKKRSNARGLDVLSHGPHPKQGRAASLCQGHHGALVSRVAATSSLI